MKHSSVIGSVIIIFLVVGAFIFMRWDRLRQVSWIEHVTAMTSGQASGAFGAVDKAGATLTFEWEKLEVSDLVFAEKLKSLSDIYVQAYAPVWVRFLQKNPETITSIDRFKFLEPLFKQGIDSVDWNFVAEKLMVRGRQVFGDLAAGDHWKHTVSWFVVVKNQAVPIGFVQFFLKPEYPFGTIKVKNLMLLPSAQHRGIGKLLMSSIFKIMPSVDLKRLVLTALQTNKRAITAYASYNFKPYEDKNKQIRPHSLDPYYVRMEYLTDQSDVLQNESQKLCQIRILK